MLQSTLKPLHLWSSSQVIRRPVKDATKLKVDLDYSLLQSILIGILLKKNLLPLYPVKGHRGDWSLSQLTMGERQGPP